ncbi:hypothetical protein [Actinomadura fibrosa]|uniref:FxLD family lantipeptide n=1 Tax=Actinomadura fibrosa TaxID=111802 RepID=A0ABW2XWA3_9ACTN
MSTSVQELQALPELELEPGHGEVEFSCTYTCPSNDSCGSTCQTQ